MKKKITLYFYYIYLICSFLTFKLFKKDLVLSKIIFNRLHCLTNGKSTNFFSEIVSKLEKKSVTSNTLRTTIFKKLEDKENFFFNQLNTDGYAIYPYKLSDKIVEKLNHFAINNFTLEIANSKRIENKKIKYCEKTLSSERLNFFIEDLIKLDYIQDLICDSSIIDICKNYFQHTPVFAEVNMWWSIVNQNKSSSEAAQLYHFDLDATKWLKIFIYLTDVDLQSGPHCYVSGTHINDDSSKKLLSKGYVRISDKEMSENYSPNKFNTILGPRGTIVFGDTRAFHKGLKPIKNDRLILELTYINSNFLYEFNKIKLSPLDIKSHSLKNNIKHSSIFQNIKLI
jgi:hypothetical protein